ncbi:MAG: aminotransferase class V-fold PLP-dependent enzyme [Phycisphaeraceae bacterium]|nr:aminotransferase class V-fold PLP-dependent enzyme [Phycisphaeraceae bacterium]
MSSQGPLRRYFDNAATSFPKPPAVAAAMLRYMNEVGAAGRGAYAEARQGAAVLQRCRERIARLVGSDSPERVVFTHNATDALNLAIKGSARAFAQRTGKRPHAIVTNMEHNSVLRPCNELARDGLLELSIINANPSTGVVDPDDLLSHVRPGCTAFVAINHASNVTGSLQNIAAIGAGVRARGNDADRPLFIVDASQSLGHIRVNAREAHIDLLAFPGHKGLLGPTGTGALVIGRGVENRLATVREGGTGSVSEQDTHPAMLPEKYEAGSHNIVGIAGLSEGVAYLLERGVDDIRAHEAALLAHLLEALHAMRADGVRVLGDAPVAQRVGVVSFTHREYSPAELAAILESEFGILTRAGLHCAPLVHRALGTSPDCALPGQGAVRLSLGPFLNADDVRAAAAAIESACGVSDAAGA